MRRIITMFCLTAIFLVMASIRVWAGIEPPIDQKGQSGPSPETKGIIIITGRNIITGMEVVNGKLMLVSNTGKRIAIPDGTFKSADGKMIIIINGRVSEVVIP